MLQSIQNEHKFDWIPVTTILGTRSSSLKEDQIIARLKTAYKKDTNPTLTFRLGQELLTILTVKPHDKVVVMQDNNSPYNFLICKAQNGLKIRKSHKQNHPEIAFRHDRSKLKDFAWTNCNYFSLTSGQVVVIIPH